jgi:hypothetical protein
MNDDEFIAYAQPFPADEYNSVLKGTFAHTFVFALPTHDWNCFGGGINQLKTQPTRELLRVKGNATWVDRVYGPDRNSPMGLRLKVDCVCHSLSNRLLAMAGTDQDVAEAEGDLFAVLMYGKYGYQLDSFIDQCVKAAKDLNAQQPGCVSPADIDTLAARVKNEEEQEADTLRRQFTERLNGHPCAATPDETKKIMGVYDWFHDQRLAAYNEEYQKGRGDDFQGRFALRLKPVFLASFTSLEAALGPERAAAIFGMTSLQAVKYLIQ